MFRLWQKGWAVSSNPGSFSCDCSSWPQQKEQKHTPRTDLKPEMQTQTFFWSWAAFRSYTKILEMRLSIQKNPSSWIHGDVFAFVLAWHQPTDTTRWNNMPLEHCSCCSVEASDFNVPGAPCKTQEKWSAKAGPMQFVAFFWAPEITESLMFTRSCLFLL